MCNKENNDCYLLSLVSSILGAIGIAAVFYTGIITSVIALVAVTLVLGIISLITLIALLYCSRDEGCYCINKNSGLATLSIPVAILIGAVAFFLITNLIALIKTIICVICITRCR